MIRERLDVAGYLQFLFPKHGDLWNLIMEHCLLGEHSTSLLANIVHLYPGLETLPLAGCEPLTSAYYLLIPRLMDLSELNLSYYNIFFIYGKF